MRRLPRPTGPENGGSASSRHDPCPPEEGRRDVLAATTRFGLEAAGPVHLTRRPTPMLEIGFSWAKGERTEWAVAKLVELGLDLLTPIVADRTVVRPDPDGVAHREGRLRKLVRQAAAQSRRPFIPEIGVSQSLDAVLERSPASKRRAGRARRRSHLARDPGRAGRSGRRLVRTRARARRQQGLARRWHPAGRDRRCCCRRPLDGTAEHGSRDLATSPSRRSVAGSAIKRCCRMQPLASNT